MRFMSVEITREGKPVTKEGFALTKEPFLHVMVGAENRDRKFFRATLEKKLTDEYAGKDEILKGSFFRTENGTLLIIEEQPEPAPRIGLLLHAVSGFRGMSLIEAESQALGHGQIWDSPIGSKGISDVVLMIAYPGDVFRITRNGRLYGAPEDLTVTVNDDFSFKVLASEDKEKEEESEVSEGEVL
jgi:hypothetical protein